ncbi:DUF6404 family protein [Photobacterium sagamiensis]|uniref:DUF6404 family protein n=1 Tax=Photobacterium sagamiensis TaxID=2910241 RepID=UPI003D0FA461
MDFDPKLKEALILLEKTGMWSSTYKPPIYRLLWRLGIKVRPPHFSSVISNFFWSSLFFGFFITLFNSIMGGLDGAGLRIGLLSAFFGLCMSVSYWLGKRKYHLLTWDELISSNKPNT